MSYFSKYFALPFENQPTLNASGMSQEGGENWNQSTARRVQDILSQLGATGHASRR